MKTTPTSRRWKIVLVFGFIPLPALMKNVPQLAAAEALDRVEGLRQGAVMPRPSFSLDVHQRTDLAACLDLSSVTARPGFESRNINDVMDFHFLNRGELASYILELNPFLHEIMDPYLIEHYAERSHLDLLRVAQSTFIERARRTAE